MLSHSSGDPRPSSNVGTSVYLYYDARNTLIYVGITDRGITRNREHNGRAEWWQYVARQEVEHLPTRREAEYRERELIRAWRPPFNKQHNPQYAEARAEYLAWIALPPVDAAALARTLNKRLPLKVVDQSDGQLILSSHLEHEAVVRLIRPIEPGEKINVAGHSSRSVQVAQNGGLLLVCVRQQTNRFPSDVAYGAAGFKFETQKPPAFRLTRIYVAARNAVHSITAGWRCA